MSNSEAATERRLLHEGGTVNLGTLVHPDVPPHSDAGQDVRVEVCYGYTALFNEGVDDLHGGYYRVVVPIIYPDDNLTDEENLASHPATLAEEIVQAKLEARAEELGWDYYEICDIRAF